MSKTKVTSPISENLKAHGWINSCDCRHSLHLHCHNQVLDSNKPNCQSCGEELIFDAHRYESDFGKNNSRLKSVYVCELCELDFDHILYEGLTRKLDDLVDRNIK